MYNGIGLRTVRGSGTNGFVQRNRSYVPPPPPQQLTHAQQRDVSMRAQLQITKKANGEMLEHERKRRIEIKVAEFEEQLRSRNFSEEEIEQKCADARIALTEQMKHTADEINLRDSHQASAAKEKENARLRAAFGIREDRPAGSAFAAMNDKGKKGEEKDAPTEDKPLRLPRSYLDRTIEKREGEEEDEDNPRRKRQRSRSPQREGQAQERERERGGREREDGDRRDERGDRGDRGDYGDRDRFRRSDDRDRRDRRDERSYDNRDRRDRRDVDEDRYRPRERSRSPFDGQPKMRDDGRDEGEPRSVIVAEPEPEQDQEETKKETEKGEEVAKEKSDDKKREREREKDKEKEKDKDKGKGKDKSSSRSKKRSKRSDSSSDSSSSDSDSDSSSSSDSDDDRHKKDSKRKRSPSQD